MDNIVIQNVTDVIGDSYKSWAPGSTVIIPSYVGSGKTHFILNELAKLADEKNKIVYLCNRKALLDQVIEKNGEKIVTELTEDSEQDCYMYNENVYILSYQYCEASDMFPNIEIPKSKLYPNLEVKNDEKIKISVNDVRYFVYEEAQYFATDIVFNEKCSFWGQKTLVFKNSTSIFMTATPEPLYCFLALKNNLNLVEEIALDIANFEKSRAEISKKISDTKNNSAYFELDLKRRNDSHKEDLHPNARRAKRVFIGRISVNVPHLHGSVDYEIKERVEKEPLEFYPYMIERYKEEWEKIKIYSVVVEYVSKIIEDYTNAYRNYNINRDYIKYDCSYFDEYIDLYKMIVENPDRWIIFVDSEADGLRLEGAINALCEYKYDLTNSNYKTNYFSPYAVFLSKETIKKKRSAAYREYKNIIEKEQFSCKILIATKLIDCGVNIDVKGNVNHIVISQPSKTEFIQMLGRVRTIDHAEGKIKKVKLYIKSIDPSTINSGASQRINDLLEVKRFVLRKVRQANAKDPVSYDFSDIRAKVDAKTISPSIKRNNNKLLFEVNEDLYIDPSYLAYCLYDIYQYYSAILNRVTDENSKLSYLKRQLSWIGKTYCKENWIGYKENTEKLCKLLSELTEKEASCNNTDLLDLKATIVSILLKQPKIIMPETFVKRINKLKEALREYKNSLAESSDKTTRHIIIKNVTLNSIFKELKIPYEIVTEKTGSKNWWKVVVIEIAADDK